MESLGNKITELRKKKKLSQDELAEVLDVTRQTVSLWETDTVIPKSDKLKALCEYFNVKPDYFLFENCAMEPLVSSKEEIAAAVVENEPKKKSRKKTVIITCALIVSVLAAGFMLFVAWLKAPPKGAAAWVSSSEWNFDIVTILQILAGIILFAVLCVITVCLIKYIKNKRK